MGNPTTLAINGFGRIGRLVLRAMIESGRDDLKVVAINDLAEPETSLHLLKYDSVHGRLQAEATLEGDDMIVDGARIKMTAERDLTKLDWAGVDVVLECTGVLTDRDKAATHLERGAKRVLVSAPSNGADATICYGINHDQLSAEHLVVSCASCTTNCLAPVAKVLHESFGIRRGFMTTIHSYTGDQPVLDRGHKDLYRARAAAMSMIPTTTGAAKALDKVLPDLKGRMQGVAVRVPTPNVSNVDLLVETERKTSVDEVNDALRAAAEGDLKGVLGVTDEKLVSVDFTHDPRSSIAALDQTHELMGDMVRVMSWYDNEWGFSNRMLDVAAVMGRHI
jgi:glyceraldehyde 3-phosphate dehydrogenase